MKRKWSPSIDPATIPDDVLVSEWGKRRAAKRRTFGAGTGRPKVMRPCLDCGVEFSASEMRKHHCKKQAKKRATRAESSAKKTGKNRSSRARVAAKKG